MPPPLTNCCSAMPVELGVNVGHGLVPVVSVVVPVVMFDGLMNAVNLPFTSAPLAMSVLVTGTSRSREMPSLTARVNIAWQNAVAELVRPQWPSCVPTRLNGYDGIVAPPTYMAIFGTVSW